MTKTSGSSLVGFARDGFEIHYLPGGKKSGWKLKEGIRPRGGPPGVYDGLFNEDYEYVGGKNTLDRCNGGEILGIYAYFITDNYPFVPRCLYGKISSDFNRNPIGTGPFKFQLWEDGLKLVFRKNINIPSLCYPLITCPISKIDRSYPDIILIIILK